jgi:acyl-CoA dehydrogenase
VNTPNVSIFKEQIETLKKFLMKAQPTPEQQKDVDFLLSLGEIFTLIPYGQLILENAKIYGVSDDLVEQIFDFMVRDFAKYALQLYHKPSSTPEQMELCLAMIKRPAVDRDLFGRVWDEVYDLEGLYEMNP